MAIPNMRVAAADAAHLMRSIGRDALAIDAIARDHPDATVRLIAEATYRLRHGAAEVTIESVDIKGAAAHVTGTQMYAHGPSCAR